MKIKATNTLTQYGYPVYKGSIVEVDSKTGKQIIENGHGIEIKPKNANKDK